MLKKNAKYIREEGEGYPFKNRPLKNTGEPTSLNYSKWILSSMKSAQIKRFTYKIQSSIYLVEDLDLYGSPAFI